MSQTTHQAIIQLTDCAANHFRKKISVENPTSGLYLKIKKTGCSGYMYQPQIVDQCPADCETIKTMQGILIFIDKKDVHLLNGTVIDFVNKNFAMQQIQFNNPNATGLCGCGESFHFDKEINE